MNLKEKIDRDLKDSMRSGDKIRLQTVRSIRALILEFEKSGKNREMTHEEEIQLLTSASKKRKEAMEQYINANRLDLSDKEEAELKIIQSYLPEQLNEEQVKEEIKRIALEIGASVKEDFPKLMPAAIKALKGKADGKLIKTIVELTLSGN